MNASAQDAPSGGRTPSREALTGELASGPIGRDCAANYQKWVDGGHRGAVEFDRWILSADAKGGHAGWCLVSSAQGGANIDTAGKSFSLYAWPPEGRPYAAAVRCWAKPALTTGDRFGFLLAVNHRNGHKGFDLRDERGNSLWNFDVRHGGYHAAEDEGQSFGPHHPETVFEFEFVQRERCLAYVIKRRGGIRRTCRGQAPLSSGAVAGIRFYASACESGDAANALFFNGLTLAYARAGDAPLTLGERRVPGWEPSAVLRFRDPLARRVTLRHGGDWEKSHALSGSQGEWSIDLRTLGLASPGWHRFKFRLDGEYEPGPDRCLFLDRKGRMAQPAAVYLGWQRDPATTMTVHWLGQGNGTAGVEFRRAGERRWARAEGAVQNVPLTESTVHTVELTGLCSDCVYEFRVSGDVEVRRFRTMPCRLDRPVRFVVGGDRDYGPESDAMTRMVAAQEPDFVVIGGDFLNSDDHAAEPWKWFRGLETWSRLAVRGDGTLIPLVAAIGNHDMRHYFASWHPDFEASAAWRERVAPHFYRFFSFPGHPGYGVLEFGDYLGLILLDSDHTNEVAGVQTAWLAQQLQACAGLRHVVPVYHVPAYPSNRGFDDVRNAQIRAHWVPLFERAGIHIAFEHHDHAWKWTKSLSGGREDESGIVFVGDGCWGVPERVPDASRWYLDAARAERHVHLVTLERHNRKIQALDREGRVFREMNQAVA